MSYADDWAGVAEPLGNRSRKPRDAGVTMVIDKGMPPMALEDWLAVAGPYVDVVKLAFGTGLLYDQQVLRRKLQLLTEANVWVCPGGTLLEIAWEQGRGQALIRWLAEMGFSALEVSDGTAGLPDDARRLLIDEGVRHHLRVLTEVGKKDPSRAPSPETLRTMALRDLEWGAWKVIVEARDSGRGIGVFDEEGVLKEGEIEALSRGIDPSLLLWEAPQPRQQVALLKCLGGEVNLGNVAAADVIALEASRRGLRSDTWAPVLEDHARRKIMNTREAAEVTAPKMVMSPPRAW